LAGTTIGVISLFCGTRALFAAAMRDFSTPLRFGRNDVVGRDFSHPAGQFEMTHAEHWSLRHCRRMEDFSFLEMTSKRSTVRCGEGISRLRSK
jgi:hypothetical protein